MSVQQTPNTIQHADPEKPGTFDSMLQTVRDGVSGFMDTPTRPADATPTVPPAKHQNKLSPPPKNPPPPRKRFRDPDLPDVPPEN